MLKKLLTEQVDFSNEMKSLWYDTTDEKAQLTSMLNHILHGKHFHKGIDIGAGPGLISKPLYERCDELTLLEPLAIYQHELTLHFPQANIVIDSLQNYAFDCYDIILFSHVLYYFVEEEWIDITSKIFHLLNQYGMLIVILLDVRWIFDLFHDKLKNQIDVHSIKNMDYIHAISELANPVVYPYNNQSLLKNDISIVEYLSMFFRLDKHILQHHCREKIDFFKEKLEKTSFGYQLATKGDVIVLVK